MLLLFHVLKISRLGKKIQCNIQIQRIQSSEARDLNYTFFRIFHSKKTWQVLSNTTFCMIF